MRLATALATTVLLSALLAACGGSSSTSGGESQAGSVRDGGPTLPGETAGEAPPGATSRSCAVRAVGVQSLRATGVSCERAASVMRGWLRRGSCAAPGGSSRTACTIRPYRCQGVRTDRGVAVSCSRPGESVAFVFRRG